MGGQASDRFRRLARTAKIILKKKLLPPPPPPTRRVPNPDERCFRKKPQPRARVFSDDDSVIDFHCESDFSLSKHNNNPCSRFDLEILPERGQVKNVGAPSPLSLLQWTAERADVNSLFFLSPFRWKSEEETG